MENKYVNGKIYKLVDNTTGDIYIGSTIETLEQRLKKHISHFNSQTKYSLTSFEILKNNDFKIELLEDYPCNSKKELETKEREHIENNICINKNIPTRTIKEYREDNKEKLKELKKIYIEENKEKIKEIQKKHYEKNKEKIKNQTKKYREENKEKIKEYKGQKITCECGAIVNIYNIYLHRKSKKHIKLMECVIIDTPCS